MATTLVKRRSAEGLPDEKRYIGDVSINKSLVENLQGQGFEYESGDPLPTRQSVPSAFAGGAGSPTLPAGEAPTPFTETDAEKIRERTRKDIQAQIDSITASFAPLIEMEKTAGLKREARTKALNLAGGTAGSPFASAAATETEEITQKNLALLEQEKSARMDAVKSKLPQLEDERIAAERERIAGDEERYFTRLKGIVDTARTQIADLGKVSTTVKDLKEKAPDRFQQILTDTGYTEFELEQYLNANRPDAAKIKYEYKVDDATGLLIAYGIDPTTGELVTKSEKIEGLKAGTNYKTQFAPDGTLVYIPDKFDPDVSPNEQVVFGGNFAKPTSGTLKETGTERNALGFYIRAKDVVDTLETGIEQDIVKKSLTGQARLEFAPNFAQSQENQVYRQLQRQFTEARLRKESGAAIPTAEYTQDAQTYFAQVGDTPETLARKKAARDKVLESLRIAAGNSYNNYYGVGGAGFGGDGATDGTEALREQVRNAGYDYDAMIADGLSDDEIKAELGL